LKFARGFELTTRGRPPAVGNAVRRTAVPLSATLALGIFHPVPPAFWG